MEVTNILEIMAHELTNEGKVPIIMNWLCWRGLHSHIEKKRKMKDSKRSLFHNEQQIQTTAHKSMIMRTIVSRNK